MQNITPTGDYKVHYYLTLASSKVQKSDIDHTDESGEKLKQFLRDLVTVIGMRIFMEPVAGFSTGVNDAWTATIWIFESDITVHYYPKSTQVELTINSCKHFNVSVAKDFIVGFWNIGEKTGDYFVHYRVSDPTRGIVHQGTMTPGKGVLRTPVSYC